MRGRKEGCSCSLGSRAWSLGYRSYSEGKVSLAQTHPQSWQVGVQPIQSLTWTWEGFDQYSRGGSGRRPTGMPDVWVLLECSHRCMMSWSEPCFEGTRRCCCTHGQEVWRHRHGCPTWPISWQASMSAKAWACCTTRMEFCCLILSCP